MKDVLVVDDELAMRTALEASFRRQGWNYSSLSSHFSRTLRSLVGSYVRTDRHNYALLRRRSSSTTTFQSCCRSFGLNFPSSGSICTRRRAPKQRDYC